jgi:hypothetical protein
MSRTFKSLILAAVAATSVAGAALADSTAYFSYGNVIDGGTVIDLGTITAAADGVVTVVDVQGNVVGTTEIHAGANPSVRVNLGTNRLTSVVANIDIGGQTVASKAFQLSR